MRFLIDKKFGTSEELIELFSDIEGITIKLCDDWSNSTYFCFSSDDEVRISPIISNGYFQVGNDRIILEICPLVYVSSLNALDLDAQVIIRVVMRISQIQLSHKKYEMEPQNNLKALEFYCPPQSISQLCSTEFKVQGKIITFSQSPHLETKLPYPKMIPEETSQQMPQQHQLAALHTPPPPQPLPHPYLHPPPPLPLPPSYGAYPPNYPPHFYSQLPHFPYPYHPYSSNPDQLPPSLVPPPAPSITTTTATTTAPPAPAPATALAIASHPPPLNNYPHSETSMAPLQRSLYSVDLFHDGENCPCSGSLNAVNLFDATIRLVISRFLGESYQGEKFDIHANVQVKWNFVLSPEKMTSSLSKFLADLETLGATRIDPGTKSDAVDTSIKKLMDQYRTDYVTRSPEANKNRIAVLISGDRDFAESLKSLRLTGANVMLIYNSENASRALRAIVPTDYVLGSWLALVRTISSTSTTSNDSTTSNSADSNTSNTTLKSDTPVFCSWCQANRGESLAHDERNCPNIPKSECAWCRQMFGRSISHQGACPNNIISVTKYKGRVSECVCIWCYKNGFRQTSHRYIFCRKKPVGVHHCPYCYRVCGIVEFHTINQCHNSPSLAEYSVGISSKKNPHVNELSLKDQIFHLEIKIVKCQETFVTTTVIAEEKVVRSKLQQLYKTEETLINQLRLLEIKTMNNNRISNSSSLNKTTPGPTSSSVSLPPSLTPLPSSTNPVSLPSTVEQTLTESTNSDLEKYQSLFPNDLSIGEMEEIIYDDDHDDDDEVEEDEGEGEDGLNRVDHPQEQAEEEGSKMKLMMTTTIENNSKKRKFVAGNGNGNGNEKEKENGSESESQGHNGSVEGRGKR